MRLDMVLGQEQMKKSKINKSIVALQDRSHGVCLSRHANVKQCDRSQERQRERLYELGYHWEDTKKEKEKKVKRKK